MTQTATKKPTLLFANFPLEPGTGVIVVPDNVVIEKSDRAAEFPDTPMFLALNRSDGPNGSYYFRIPGERLRSKYRGTPLFVPAGTKTGDKLVIEWRVATCAGARFATVAEIAEADPPKPPMSNPDAQDAGWPRLSRGSL